MNNHTQIVYLSATRFGIFFYFFFKALKLCCLEAKKNAFEVRLNRFFLRDLLLILWVFDQIQ